MKPDFTGFSSPSSPYLGFIEVGWRGLLHTLALAEGREA